jgi:hypothetical protein
MSADDIVRLMKEGKIAEARALLAQTLEKSKYEPNTFASGKDGRVRFYRGRTRVEFDEAEKVWKPAKSSPTRKKKRQKR